MYVFNMFSQIVLISACLATEGTSVNVRPLTHNVLIQLLVPSCKQQTVVRDQIIYFCDL